MLTELLSAIPADCGAVMMMMIYLTVQSTVPNPITVVVPLYTERGAKIDNKSIGRNHCQSFRSTLKVHFLELSPPNPLHCRVELQ